MLTGEDPYADIKAKIKECKTKSDISRLYSSLKEPAKSELKDDFKHRQNEINESNVKEENHE